MFGKKTITVKDILFFVLFAGIMAWVCVLCIYHLDESGIHNWDEARHIVNAYEMWKTKNWWIHTYKYATDYYNYKPPLSMWGIIVCFCLGGAGFHTMRLYSAIAMILHVFIVCAFVFKNWGKSAALTAAVLLASGTDIYFFHMARSADADSLYLLMLTLSLICLYESEKNPWYLTGCGVFLSLAFMTKCLHVAIGVVIAVCYIPRFFKKLKWQHLLGALIGGLLPAGIWAGIRICYDGFTFFGGMLKQEVFSRVEEAKNYFGYIRYFAGKPAILFACAAAIIAGISLVLEQRHEEHGKKGRNISEVMWKIIHHPLYLPLLWLLVPFLAYSASGAFMEWYGYICFFPFSILISVIISKSCRKFEGKKKWLPVVLYVLLLIGFCFSVRKQMTRLRDLSYINNTDLRADVAEMLERYPEYGGCRIYIENSRNEYLAQNEWEQNCVADVYILGDLQPIDGGVPLFTEDEDAVLVISKDLFESYSSILAGRVILVDGNDYLIFNNEFYG